MGVVTIRCPRTGARVSTGLETDRRSFDAMPVVSSYMHCPACGVIHVWSKTWAELTADDATTLTPSAEPAGERPIHP